VPDVVKYGPQASEIEALISRALNLTTGDIRRFNGAIPYPNCGRNHTPGCGRGHKLMGAQFVASRVALDARAADSIRSASAELQDAGTVDGVRIIAGNDARLAARLAVTALVLRHLIGRHGFTRDDYDALTRPWAKVIGPAHPDDVEV
jgi:hypothetical protein